jgi:hypothetical protein
MDPAYVNDQSAASRCFVALPPPWGSEAGSVKRTYMWIYGFMGGVIAISAAIYVISMQSPESETRIEIGIAVLVAFVLITAVWWRAYASRYANQRFRVSVTNDAVTVDKRPGDVFSVSEAKLGAWAGVNGMPLGTALHLQRGPESFVLAGRDHRIGAGARLDAPPVSIVDAWISAADFDELLTIVGRRGRLDAVGPAPGETIRCLLFPNPQLAQQTGAFAGGERRRLLKAALQPRLAIDMRADAIRVIDANTNALVASAAAAQVTATPETYLFQVGGGGGFAFSHTADVSPVLVVRIPGMQPLTITCLDKSDRAMSRGAMTPRFSWAGDVGRRSNDPADFMVGGGDWLTLVEKFGLATYLEERG